MKKIVILSAFIVLVFMSCSKASGQQTVATTIVNSFQVQRMFLDANDYFAKSYDIIILDDEDTLRNHTAPLFRQVIISACKKMVIDTHTVSVLKFEEPKNVSLFRIGDLVELSGGNYLSKIKPITKQVSPEEIVARIATLVANQGTNGSGILPTPKDGYSGTFIGFCQDMSIKMYSKKCSDNKYRWYICCDWANSITPAGENIIN